MTVVKAKLFSQLKLNNKKLIFQPVCGEVKIFQKIQINLDLIKGRKYLNNFCNMKKKQGLQKVKFLN